MEFRLLQHSKGSGWSGGGGGGGGKISELQFHGTPLIIAWLPVVTFAVLIALMRWHKFSFYAHVFLALTVIGLTLGATIPLLVDKGVNYDAKSVLQKTHNYTGSTVVIWLGVQIITGILARVIQYFAKVNTNFCIWTKRVHQISSYFLMIAAKFNYLNIKFKDNQIDSSFYLLLGIDIVLLIFYLLIKFGYWTLGQEIIDNQLIAKDKVKQQNKAIQVCQSERNGLKDIPKEIKDDEFNLKKRKEIQTHYSSDSQISLQNYVIFNEYVYDTSDFKERHPGGERIMSLVNKREVDRFLYGCYGPQLEPSVKPYNHSQDSLRLCGEPVAKIDRVSPMKGFQNFNKCNIFYRQQVSASNDTYLVHLKPKKASLLFQGFQSENQIGQYFSLTITNQKGRQRCTRLYTTLWCMRFKNTNLMQRYFPFFNSLTPKIAVSQIQMNQIKFSSTENLQDIESIPLIIKKYQKGELTPKICDKQFNGKIILSEPMGSGLKFDTISSSGSVVFVCGGTGILPFCDFIDLLFKRSKVLDSHNLSGMLVKMDPLVGTDFIKQRTFNFYCAIENAADLPVMTIHQLNELCKSTKVKFSCVMRIKKGEDLIRNNYQSIMFQKNYFTSNIKEHLKEGNISQIYICGPPQMNADVGKVMVENQISSSLYHFM